MLKRLQLRKFLAVLVCRSLRSLLRRRGKGEAEVQWATNYLRNTIFEEVVCQNLSN